MGAVSPARPREELPGDAWWAPKPSAPAAPVSEPVLQPSAPPPAPRASPDGRCPECGSGDYRRASPETRAYCYTCGYPIRHTTSGMAATGKSSTPARQVPTSGYQPKKVIGRVG